MQRSQTPNPEARDLETQRLRYSEAQRLRDRRLTDQRLRDQNHTDKGARDSET